MAPLIAPGPDGMSPIIYKSFWHTVDADVTIVVLWALNSSLLVYAMSFINKLLKW